MERGLGVNCKIGRRSPSRSRAARAALPRDLLSRLVPHVTLQLAGIWLLTVVVARLVGWRGPTHGALLVAALFASAGNVGLPLALFACGPAWLAVAGGWFAVTLVRLR